MPKFTVDGTEYETEDLSDNGKGVLANLQFIEAQIQRIRNEMAVYQTAQLSYVATLKSELEETKSLNLSGKKNN